MTPQYRLRFYSHGIPCTLSHWTYDANIHKTPYSRPQMHACVRDPALLPGILTAETISLIHPRMLTYNIDRCDRP